MKSLLALAALVGVAAARTAPRPASAHNGDWTLPSKIDAGPTPTFKPELLPYDPHAQQSAMVYASDGWARFTVLTPRLIRMEYATVKGRFEVRPAACPLKDWMMLRIRSET